MLCSLGESIEVTVELLASHVFLTPCLIHPGLAFHQDPEAWFGAQKGRLRWVLSLGCLFESIFSVIIFV